MKNLKSWYTSKTIWYAVLTGIAGVVTAIQVDNPDIGLLTTINALITIALRLISDKGIA